VHSPNTLGSVKRALPALIVLLALAACGDDGGSSTSRAGLATTTTGAVPSPTTTAVTSTTGPPATTTTQPEPIPLDEVGELTIEPVGDRLPTPIFLTVRADDERLYVANQNGVIDSMTDSGEDLQVVLDLRDKVWFANERGLLGLAFHPSDPERMFVHYSRSGDYATMIEEYHLPVDAVAADPDPVRTILTHRQPAANHNGGMLAFGPDGYLYIALGDGGGGGDTYGNGQDPFTILGAILRIDVDGGEPFAIPDDNPFADGEDGAPEVWLWGLRNPWRFSFDGGAMWIADVGQGSWEEIDLVPPGRGGANLGWPILEGSHCFDGPQSRCDDNDFISPVHEYSHEEGRCSVTGGYVYRGSDHPDLVGAYFFGDYCSGEIMVIRVGEGTVVDSRVFDVGIGTLTSFGVDHDGELYVMAGNQVYRVGFEA